MLPLYFYNFVLLGLGVRVRIGLGLVVEMSAFYECFQLSIFHLVKFAAMTFVFERFLCPSDFVGLRDRQIDILSVQSDLAKIAAVTR